jgi:hypothetical protein
LIFGEGEKEKVSPKIVSPNKEAVFFFDRYFFFGNGIRIKCHQIGMDQKVSPKVLLDQSIDEKMSPKSVTKKVSPNNFILNLKKFFESL